MERPPRPDIPTAADEFAADPDAETIRTETLTAGALLAEFTATCPADRESWRVVTVSVTIRHNSVNRRARGEPAGR